MLRYIEGLDLTGLFVLALILLFVGNKVSQGNLRVRTFAVGMSALALVAFIGWNFSRGTANSDNLVELSFRGLLLAGIFLGAAWILLTIVAGLYGNSASVLSRWSAGVSRMRADRKQRIEDEKLKKEQEGWRAASEKENEKRKAKREEDEKLAAEARKKRDDARATCEVLFATHCFEIRQRFPKETYDAFVSKHLGDDKPPDYVEQRAVELCDIIKKHLEKVEGRGKKDLAELAKWYLEERKRIEATLLTDDDKNLLIAQLEERYVKLQEQYLRSVQP